MARRGRQGYLPSELLYSFWISESVMFKAREWGWGGAGSRNKILAGSRDGHLKISVTVRRTQ